MSTKHIIATYHMASDEEIAAGSQWYADANDLALTLVHGEDHRPKVDIYQAAGVIAALSPRVDWARNKELAIRAVTDHKASGTLGQNVRTANAILDGGDLLDLVKGLKVRNFYRAILGDADAVTVDRHAFEVWKGVRYGDRDRPSITPRVYAEAATAYRDAARELGVRARDLQAITWLTWRRIHLTGTRYERFL